MTEYNHPDDTLFYYIAEYPNGIPESRVHYYWVWGTLTLHQVNLFGVKVNI